jgi:hypothetical protein
MTEDQLEHQRQRDSVETDAHADAFYRIEEELLDTLDSDLATIIAEELASNPRYIMYIQSALEADIDRRNAP